MQIQAKFISDNEVQLDFRMSIQTKNNASARHLAALSEAGLIDIVGDRAVPRRTRAKCQKGEELIIEERHGGLLFMLVRKNQRRLKAAFDLETPFKPKKSKAR